MDYCSYTYNDKKMEKEVTELLKCKSLKIDQSINWEKLFNGYSDLLIYTLNYVIKKIPDYLFKSELLFPLLKSIKDNFNSLTDCSDTLKIYDDAKNIIMNLMVLFSVEFECGDVIEEINFNWNSKVKRKIMFFTGRLNLSHNDISRKEQTEDKVNKKHTIGKMLMGAGGVVLAGPLGGLTAYMVKNKYDNKKKEKAIKDWIASEYFIYIMRVSYHDVNKKLEVLGYDR